uniref:Melanin-concentrating hormone n=1 Tax=Scophthalmus maximus TaxID=52904 RepID=A0A8D3ATB0_SCOMX
MRQSFVSVVFAAALLLKCYVLSGASPFPKTEDGYFEQDTFTSLLGDEATENNLSDADLGTGEKTSGSRVIVVADPARLIASRSKRCTLHAYMRTASSCLSLSERRG